MSTSGYAFANSCCLLLHLIVMENNCCYCLVAMCPTLCDLMDCSPPSSSIHGIFPQEYWSGVLFPTPGGLPDSGIKLHLLLGRKILYQGTTREAHIKQSTMQNCVLSLRKIHSLPGNRLLRVILFM